MNIVSMSLLIVCSSLFITGCTKVGERRDSDIIDFNKSSIINSELSLSMEETYELESATITRSKPMNIIKMPITLMSRDVKGERNVKYLEVDENSHLEEKMQLIVNAISKECFNNLPITVTVWKDDTARVELKEPEDVENSRVSWKDDYLNETVKEETINILLGNILQEEYKGKWIEKVQLYYEGELITLD